MPKRLAIVGPYQVEVLDYQDPPLQPDQVLVKTEFASGKHGTTFGMFDGRTFQGQRFDLETRLFLPVEEQAAKEQAAEKEPSRPHNTGTTGVGTIVQAGSEVTRWQAGDRVFGFMDVRETNICSQDRLWALGEIDPLLALCVEPAYVSFHCIRESQIRYGESVAVIGLGALGMLAVRMAVQGGAETVFAVDMLPNRLEWAARNGADHVLNPAECDVGLEIHKLTHNTGTDVAIELAGAYPALNAAIRSVRVGGTVCSAGFYQGEAHNLWLGREWHHNRLTIVVPHGCGWGHTPRDYPAWDEKRAYDCIVSMMRKNKLTAPGLIDPVISIDQGPEIFRLIKEDPGQVIKYAVQF
ncbi:MAG: zinc-binding dehydrogenase [Anaerolineae bacterium]|nr:zinc-binding dehydrogenase [Anaerolineae bacterium]